MTGSPEPAALQEVPTVHGVTVIAGASVWVLSEWTGTTRVTRRSCPRVGDPGVDGAGRSGPDTVDEN